MKKIIAAIAVVTMGLSASSCADFLDVQPEGNPNQGGYFQTDKEAEDAIGAVYWIFDKEETWGRNLFWEQGCGDDMVCNQSRWPSLMNFQYTGDESPLTDNWEKMTEYIARANWVVAGLKAKGVDKLTAVETRTLGEALFMRAFLHFHIAYRYGRADNGCPFIRYEDYPNYTETMLSTIPSQQATVMDNYKLIEDDLKEAAGYLPFFETYGAEDQGRAHKVAAWALQVKLYAYWAYHDKTKWELIPDLVDKIEKEGNRALLGDFADVFKMANNYSSEYIWSATGTGRKEGGPRFPGVCLVNKGWGIFNGWGSLKPSRSLWEEYEEGDTRRDISVYSYGMTIKYFGAEQPFTDPAGDKIVSGFMFAKYMEPYTYGQRVLDEEGNVDASKTVLSNPYVSTNGNDMTTDLNIPLIRFAEMVLFKAEALIEMGEGGKAAIELNRLTQRCGLGQPYATATMEDLMHERRCELAGEFTDRFMDLKRWKQYDKLEQQQYDRVPVDPSKAYDPDTNPWAEKQVIWPVGGIERKFEPEFDLVFPYPPLEVTKANGKLKQNPIGN
ncbi:RagB/SusD family nutrient uptake outer membrane protein [uncultured Alistipes sp.]|uniref:RagB/SusD family nutrient uptake outer membrane protein n=2 Tax=uncultured Alistipes sp. TaxID=538949 RepID=UPI0025DAEE84|nr:RagB/SusD family nutrient uptake outer membrane protein [uncultured Alistipes sp.]